MATRKGNTIITCPYCGAEYFPVEIYTPDCFFGRPLIEKTATGIMRDFCEDEMDLNEEYRCDYCNKLFKVTASVHFKATGAEEAFEEIYSSPLHTLKLTLDENLDKDPDEDLIIA